MCGMRHSVLILFSTPALQRAHAATSPTAALRQASVAERPIALPPVNGDAPMAQPTIPSSEKPGTTFQPPCPTCGVPMWLLRLSQFSDDSDLRTFKCQVCGHTESRAVQFKQVA